MCPDGQGIPVVAQAVSELRARCQLTAPSSGIGLQRFTVGVEHEFILLAPDGLPARHADSQRLLSAFSRLPGAAGSWNPSELGPMLTQVHLPLALERYVHLKYDHHPHVLELAFSPWRDLHAAQTDVAVALEHLQRLVPAVGLTLAGPVLEGDALADRFCSPLEAFVGLRHYRTRRLERLGVAATDAVNYAATVAATQTHVGGMPWRDEPQWLQGVHGHELAAGMFAWSGLGLRPHDRWRRYDQAFTRAPLSGFPAIQQWSMNAYAHALLHSPLAGGPADAWAGATLAELGGIADLTWDGFFERVRDFSIIRPRRFGTLEFRADPAQPTAERIVGVAAIRLAQVLLVALNGPPAVDLAAQSRQWWAQVRTGELAPAPDAAFLARCRDALEARGLGESRYLDVWS